MQNLLRIPTYIERYYIKQALRVNQAGESCAVAIHAVQNYFMPSNKLIKKIYLDEQEHLQIINQKLKFFNIKASKYLFLTKPAGWILGCFSSNFIAHSLIKHIENHIYQHYMHQSAFFNKILHGQHLAELFFKLAQEELHHAQMAQHQMEDNTQGPGSAGTRYMQSLVKIFTKTFCSLALFFYKNNK